jgi:hypothetical protein
MLIQAAPLFPVTGHAKLSVLIDTAINGGVRSSAVKTTADKTGTKCTETIFAMATGTRRLANAGFPQRRVVQGFPRLLLVKRYWKQALVLLTSAHIPPAADR